MARPLSKFVIITSSRTHAALLTPFSSHLNASRAMRQSALSLGMEIRFVLST